MNTTTEKNGKLPIATTASITIDNVPLKMIVESKTNPRKTFAELDELAADFKTLDDDGKPRGVLQPILVRPTKLASTPYEIVFGARRYRAAKLAGLATIPAMVRELDDKTALEIQIVENSKRSDIHPLEEADGYAMLHEKHGYTVEEIAAKVGKSTATIYGRLKLVTLCKDARKAFFDGKISAAIAVLLAKIADPVKQAEATKKALTDSEHWSGDNDGVMTLSEVRDLVRHEYMLVLKDAAFDRADATLVPAAGACTTCPKRTGANPTLFSDLESKDDLCTDANCFASKKDADWKRKSEDAKKKGLKVLSDAEAKKVLPAYGAVGGGFVDLSAKNYDDKKQRTNKEILGKKVDELEIVIARDKDGNTHELVAKKEFAIVAPAAAVPVRDARAEDREKQRRKAELAKEKAREAAHAARIASVVDIAGKREPNDALWRAMAVALVDANHWRVRDVCKRRAIAVEEKQNASEVLKKLLAKASAGEARGVCVELLCESGSYGGLDRLKAFEAALGGGAKKPPKAKVKLKAKKPAKKKGARK